MINYRLAREEMVDTLARKGIRDERVLAAMREVKRHQFVSPNLRARAYEDTPLPIGEGQTISQPFMVAKMTELLSLKGEGKVLEIGTGSGYQTCILALLATKVFTVELITSLAAEAKKRFEKMGVTNIVQKVGDGTLGWREFAPYDRIIVTAGAPHVPGALLDQLAEGGVMVIPTGPRRVQDLKRIEKRGGKPLVTSEGGCVFVPLLGSDGWV
ncbi:MAG TPA: protein-L-isoaspartate(D-aspartate) O-methyltransferase [Bacteroidetes bacterium]|nr:protein-L-isoaspartate(D-aspartate) O-methyltransferase [Bacteroidota bacterium]